MKNWDEKNTFLGLTGLIVIVFLVLGVISLTNNTLLETINSIAVLLILLGIVIVVRFGFRFIFQTKSFIQTVKELKRKYKDSVLTNEEKQKYAYNNSYEMLLKIGFILLLIGMSLAISVNIIK